MRERLAADGVMRAQPSRSLVVNIQRRREEAAAPRLKLLCFVSPTPGNAKRTQTCDGSQLRTLPSAQAQEVLSTGDNSN